jgi:N-acetylglucosamine-6-phosphate deacetylase
VLTDEGKLHLAGKPTVLAGSAQALLWGINHLLRLKLASLGKAWDMASTYPNQLLNRPQQAGLTVGAPADLVSFRKDASQIYIDGVVKAGNVWKAL